MTIIGRHPVLLAVGITAVSVMGMTSPTNAQKHPQERHARQQHKEQLKEQEQQEKKRHKTQQHQEQQLRQQLKKAEHRQEKQEHKQQKAEHREQKRQQQVQRLSQQQQQQLIAQQQQRLTQYRRHLEAQRLLAHQQSARLQQEKRNAQYRFQQQYFERLRQQQVRIEHEPNYDYSSDPYFHSPPSHRYLRDGNYRETNHYGAELLQRAVKYGYQEGYRAGEADREDRWTSSYQDSGAYRDANYGYNGYYVERDDYNHYFREGFHRGYDDGYDRRQQYGSSSNGENSILGTVLAAILNLQSLR